jgi:Tfp pilus assembly protein PilN
MIRVNLLEQREASKTKSGGLKLPSASLGAIASVLVVVIAVGWLGFVTWQRNARIGELEEENARANQELQALTKALAKVDEFESKRAALEQRVRLISELKRRQQVPVHLLDQVSRELPDFLWLERMNEKAGELQLIGRATTYNAVSNFYNNLRDSSFFSDVTLGTTKRVPEGVTFALFCKFNPPGQATTEQAAMTPAGQGG